MHNTNEKISIIARFVEHSLSYYDVSMHVRFCLNETYNLVHDKNKMKITHSERCSWHLWSRRWRTVATGTLCSSQLTCRDMAESEGVECALRKPHNH